MRRPTDGGCADSAPHGIVCLLFIVSDAVMVVFDESRHECASVGPQRAEGVGDKWLEDPASIAACLLAFFDFLLWSINVVADVVVVGFTADALVRMMIVKSRATLLPLQEESSKFAGRSRLCGKCCSGVTGSLAIMKSSATVSRSVVCPREMAPDRLQVTACTP